MKKILITGRNSYIGNSLAEFLMRWNNEYEIDRIGVRSNEWKNKDFSSYDVIYDVAGIAHIKENLKNISLYYEVNCNLAIKLAEKAKAEGVKQFIYLSSMSVYGMETGEISKQTEVMPQSSYGRSKVEAEKGLKKLEDKYFKIVILRPPMVYGKECKGNFQLLIKMVQMLHVFPDVQNKRSMIYIDNLSSFVKRCIDDQLRGVYLPQNEDYMNTTCIAVWIAEAMNKKIWTSKLLGLCVKCLRPFIRSIKKGFGSLIYIGTDDFNYEYCVVKSEESIKRSV